MLQSEPIAALANGHGVVEAEMVEADSRSVFTAHGSDSYDVSTRSATRWK